MDRHCPGSCLCWCLQLSLLLVTGVHDGEGLGLTNVALNKPATQSSYHGVYGRPENVVDGNKDTSMSQCTHTAISDSNPDRWWRVDLQGMFEIHTVVITNRGECCGDRLADFDINVAQSLSDATQGWQDSSRLCLHHPGQIGLGSTDSLDCSQPVSGRYVTLVLPTSDYPLHFCEMEVLAVLAVPVQRTNTYRNQPGHKAPGDVISETYVRSVIDCPRTCSAQDGCTAVNLQTASNAAVSGGRRLCQLVDYGGANPPTVVPDNGWNFYELYTTTETWP